MIEVSIPKDIRDFEPTLVGPLTTRKFVCLIAMVGGVYGTYMLEKSVGVEEPLSAPFFLIVGLIPFLIGWFKPYGQHFEKFIGKAVRDNFIAPKNRLYKIENMWDTIAEEEKANAEGQDPAQRQKERKKEVKETPRSKLPQELRGYK